MVSQIGHRKPEQSTSFVNRMPCGLRTAQVVHCDCVAQLPGKLNLRTVASMAQAKTQQSVVSQPKTEIAILLGRLIHCQYKSRVMGTIFLP
jgi:hypothetical protein